MTALPQIIRGLSFREYCEIDALNFSLAKELLVSPLHFQAARTQLSEESMAMRLGTCVHDWVLRGKKPEYVIKPEGMTFATKEGKAWRSAQTLPILTQEEAEKETRMCDAIADNTDACRYLAACEERELTIVTEYRHVKIKALIDIAKLKDSPGIIDLKTARGASPRQWGSAVAEYKLLMQAAWYRNALALALGSETPPAFAWIVCETSLASPVQIYRATEEQLTLGQRMMDKAIDLYLACQALGEWPAYGTGEMQFPLPMWALKEAEGMG